jgi:periplasmic divalent cation tolerance protein
MSAGPADVRVAFVSAPDLDVARRIGRALVAERLAACVNLVPGVTSIYRWQGEVQEDAEVLLVVKTRAERLPALAERLRVLHPYALPELVAWAPDGGSAPYLAWVCAETEESS